jgi:hypothetical protein
MKEMGVTIKKKIIPKKIWLPTNSVTLFNLFQKVSTKLLKKENMINKMEIAIAAKRT